MKTKLLRLLALIVPPLAIFTGDLFATSDLNVGEISNAYFGEVLIIPSGYAFAIWGFIYLGILGLAVVQTLPKYAGDSHMERARLPLIVNMACNFAWIVTWQSLLFEWATIILLLQLATALWLYYGLKISEEPAESIAESWIRVPISVYVGWLTLASVLGISSLLVHWGWEGLGLSNSSWAVIMLIVSAVLGLGLKFILKDGVYAAVFVWAYIAVALRPDQVEEVATTAVVLAVIFAAVVAAHMWVQYRYEPTPVVAG